MIGAYLAGVATPGVVIAAVFVWTVATERTGWQCRVCGWSTGMRAALPSWLRWRWHRHVTRSRFGRCGRAR